MHRSGTSALTGVLSIAGCATPVNQIAGGAQNPKGFFEARLVARLDDRLLEQLGRSWDDWRPLPEGWQDDPAILACTQEGQDLILDEFGTPLVLALKDPRICRLFPYWSRVLNLGGATPMAVLTHRHPMAVARSLQTRNGFGPEKSLLLWLTYVLEAEHQSRGTPRVFVSNDQLMADPMKVLEKIERQLEPGFPKPVGTCASEVGEFINVDLQHHHPAEELALPGLLRAAYEVLEGWAETGETEAGRRTLDRGRQMLQLAAGSLPDRADTVETHSKTLYQTLIFLSGPDRQAKEAFDRMQKLNKADLTELNQTLSKGNAALHEDLRQVEEAVILKTADIDRLQSEVAVRDRELGTLARFLHQAETRAEDLDGKLAESLQAARTTGEALQAVLQEKEFLTAEQAKLQKQTRQSGLQQEALAQEKDQLAAENAELHALVARVEGERRALAESTIWRCTAPLRWVLNRLTGRRA